MRNNSNGHQLLPKDYQWSPNLQRNGRDATSGVDQPPAVSPPTLPFHQFAPGLINPAPQLQKVPGSRPIRREFYLQVVQAALDVVNEDDGLFSIMFGEDNQAHHQSRENSPGRGSSQASDNNGQHRYPPARARVHVTPGQRT